jgi:hypothetical protein
MSHLQQYDPIVIGSGSGGLTCEGVGTLIIAAMAVWTGVTRAFHYKPSSQ